MKTKTTYEKFIKEIMKDYIFYTESHPFFLMAVPSRPSKKELFCDFPKYNVHISIEIYKI